MGDCIGSNNKYEAAAEGPMLAANTPKKRGGRKKFKETRHPTFRGVRWRTGGKWVCETREPNKKTTIWLGTFPTPEMAARAHDVASIALRGNSACLNYADSVWRLPIPSSSNMRDIQRAAGEAAEMFRPHSHQAPAASSSTPPSTSSDYADMVDEYLQNEPHPHHHHDEVKEMDTWVDEDVFSMPQILSEMYSGMMLPPPPQPPPPPDDLHDHDAHFPLWSF